MKRQEFYIFHDESGKNTREVALVGAISIPAAYYTSAPIQTLNRQLQNNKFKMHFTNYDRRDYQRYREVISVFTAIPNQVNLNLLLFQKTLYKQKESVAGQFADMIYQEIPEKVIYGLFRDNSNFVETTAKVFMEEAQEYRDRHLANKLKNRLNTHFLYRFDNYQILTAELVSKNQQIGVELTDCLLGICGLIIQNRGFINDQGQVSKKLLAKTLLVIDLLPDLKQLFEQTKVFELCGQSKLVARNFQTYLRTFQASVASCRQQYPNYFVDRYKRID